MEEGLKRGIRVRREVTGFKGQPVGSIGGYWRKPSYNVIM